MSEQGVVQSGPEAEILEEAGIDLTTIRRVSLNKIKSGRFQPRRSFNEEKLRELADDIEGNGQVEPGILNDLGDGNFELIAGERRWRALKMTSYKTFRAVIVRIDDMKLIAKLACASNGKREDLNDLDLLESCLELRSRHGFSDNEIAAALGRSVQWVSNTFTLDRLHGKIRPLLGSAQRGGISRSVALQLVRVQPSDQLTLLREARKGQLGEKRLRRLVDELTADDRVALHSEAQDRRTPTESFLKLVSSTLGAARESVERSYKGTRRRKLAEVEADDALKIRTSIKQVRDALDCLESVLP